MRNPTFFLVLLWSLWLTACSGDSTSSNAGGTPAAPTTAQETLSVAEAPQAAQPSADVLVRHLLARAIPGPITQLRFTPAPRATCSTFLSTHPTCWAPPWPRPRPA